ncbi:hypothetical protein PG993_010901 [Apiospora rasikravindrae]|uniref:Nephrocystin 3-like N-terminal domain-containing protein n=1 Tax=Apiospora rasikravindrae TaxID=990691 RepID=A0ABR1SDY4_9PEZI
MRLPTSILVACMIANVAGKGLRSSYEKVFLFYAWGIDQLNPEDQRVMGIQCTEPIHFERGGCKDPVSKVEGQPPPPKYKACDAPERYYDHVNKVLVNRRRHCKNLKDFMSHIDNIIWDSQSPVAGGKDMQDTPTPPVDDTAKRITDLGMDQNRYPAWRVIKDGTEFNKMIEDVANVVTRTKENLSKADYEANKARFEGVTTALDQLRQWSARLTSWLMHTTRQLRLFLKSYPKDENILAVSVDLVLAIFMAIEEAVGFYTSAQAKHAGLAILDGKEYQQMLLRALKEIGVYSEKLWNRASLSFQHRMISDGDATRQAHAAMMQNDWATHQALSAILHGQLEGNAQSAWIAKLLTIFLGVLSDRENNWRPVTPTPLLPNSVSGGFILPSPNPGPIQWTKTELLSHLRAPSLDEADLQHVLCNSGEAILEHRDRAEQVMAARELHNWMTTRGSYRLLAHGNFESTDAIDRRVTPLSVLCATLVRTLRLSGESVDGIRISLVFFCGLHRRDDAYSGGVAMIRSLAQQLVEHFPAPTIELDPRLDIGKLENGDLGELCRLFMCLMHKLPPGITVFCLIDGVQEYENTEHLPDMMAVIMSLITLVNECNRPTGGIFKLLLISPCETVELRREFDQLPGGLLHMTAVPSF